MIDIILFGLFAATLLGIARYHKYALQISLSGLLAVLAVKLTMDGDFTLHAHFIGNEHHHGEWQILVNLAGLLLGFAVLADYFERSGMPDKLTELLPGGKKGAFALLVLIAVLSALLDNIAAALIGGAAAITLFRRKVHIGYLAAMVAASNAGGAGSVIGDTTTTMMWIEGASPFWMFEAFIGAAVSIAFFGYFAAAQQNGLQPLVKPTEKTPPVKKMMLLVVGLIIVGAITANVKWDFPAAGVWAAILIGTFLSRANWKVLPNAAHGMIFLVCLVTAASMMPVENLPAPSQWSALGLGFVSAFFDNIPLTKLAIAQDGYDWGILAYAVGYGGSMLWFGSSAGVAIAGLFTEAKSVKLWIVQGWHVAVGYVLGFIAMILVVGWFPHPIKLDHSIPSNQVHEKPVKDVKPDETGKPEEGTPGKPDKGH
ncbi:MAG: Na+/H+ antiporter NhaD/arsenite permease-like protein [Planctomycetota bacterium]